MPVYEYGCGDCGTFELLRGYQESGDGAHCPECGAEARRMYSAPAVSDRTGTRGMIRREMERGPEPGVSRKYSPGDPSPRRHKSGGRPWQIGH